MHGPGVRIFVHEIRDVTLHSLCPEHRPQGAELRNAHSAPAEKHDDRAADHNQLYAEQVRLLFRFSVVGSLATLLVIILLGAILWDDLAAPGLFWWFAVISLVTTARYALYKAFIRRERSGREIV